MDLLRSLLEPTNPHDEAPLLEPTVTTGKDLILEATDSRSATPPCLQHDFLFRVRRRLFGSKENRKLADQALIILTFFLGGTAFYTVFDKHFGFIYGFFYATNVGLSVGYAEQRKVRTNFTKLVTVLYLLLGSSVIMSALGTVVNTLAARANRSLHVSDIVLSFVVYCAALGFGLWAASFQNFNSFADMLLFTVGNFTTAGLITPRDSFSSLFWTSCSLLVGVPANFVFMGTLANAIGRFFYGTSAVDNDDNKESHQTRPEITVDHLDSAYLAFLEAELVRLNRFSREDLRHCRENFRRKAQENAAIS